MNQSDIFMLGFSLVFAIIFVVLGMSKIIKLYIGLLLGLLICLLLHLKLNSLAEIGATSNMVDYFFSKNRAFFETLSIFSIPILGILFLLNSSFTIKESSSSLMGMIISGILGVMLFPFLLGLYALLNGFGLSNSSLLARLMDLLGNSLLGNIFSNFQHYIFLLLLGILLYKFVLKFLFLILVYFFNKIRELRAEERAIRRRRRGEEEEDETDTNDH